MTRPLAIAVAVLALPAAAAAKEVQSAAVCGADGCQPVEHKQRLDLVLGSGGPPGTPPSRHAPFYVVHVKIKGDPQRMRLLVVPRLHRVRGFDGQTWFQMPADNLTMWRGFLRHVRPYPAAKLPGVEPSAPPPVVQPAPRPAHDDDGDVPWWALAAIGAAVLALLGVRLRPWRGTATTP